MLDRLKRSVMKIDVMYPIDFSECSVAKQILEVVGDKFYLSQGKLLWRVVPSLWCSCWVVASPRPSSPPCLVVASTDGYG